MNQKTLVTVLTMAVLLGGLFWHAATRLTRLEEQVQGLREDVSAMKSLLYVPSIPLPGGR